MKGNTLILAVLCLLLLWTLPADSMGIRFSFTVPDDDQVVPLDMAEDSVDDMYFGCNKEMMELVERKYFKEESKELFANKWEDAKDCVKQKLGQRTDPDLTELHLTAICLYTSNNVYTTFNKAVRTQRNEYTSSFQFHSLHYLLTSAIQILKKKPCLTTYRRTKVRFAGNVNQIIRFGSFASSSLETTLTHFGKASCFQIKTCFGAYLKHYSIFGTEEEVLIPPYETFKITEIIRGKNNIEGLSDCKVVYILEHEGTKSQLNCKVVYNTSPVVIVQVGSLVLPFLNILNCLSQLIK
uniref:NAD(P)(+)--arginine ADP-ribosyltransferase n=1 Tax=Monopterus albus TaxID=43700 RepID=A0A3Q3JAY7_MONAL